MSKWKGDTVVIRNLIAVITEVLAGGVKLEIPMEDEPVLVARMPMETGSCIWKVDDAGEPVNAGEFQKHAQLGCILEIDGSIELRGRRSSCPPADLAKTGNRFWILPRRVCIRYTPTV